MPVTKSMALSLSCIVSSNETDGVIYAVTLKNRDLSVSLTNYGCTITAVLTPDRNGALQNIVAGYNSLNEYADNPAYFGCILGRVANRIAEGIFEFDGKVYQLAKNNGNNHLHGGVDGFNKKIFDIISLIETEENVGVEMGYLSKDGEEGYPGNLKVKVCYLLDNENNLTINYTAETDQPTPVNLSNHSYFNLTGFNTPDVTQHKLLINADRYTEAVDDIPTGNISGVDGTPFDFSVSTPIGGFDHNQNYVLNSFGNGEVSFAARLCEESTGRVVSVYTDQPGMQLYTASYWDGTIKGAQGKYYQKYGAVALETQRFPDSVNHPDFPSTILRPGHQYKTTTIYKFGLDTDINQNTIKK